MKKLVLFSALLFIPFQVAASGLQASFGGSNLSGMTRPTTRFESWGDVDPAGLLIDHSGRGHHLTPSATAPTTGMSVFQDSSGRRINARLFDGTNNYYSTATVSDFNIYTSDVTITAVVLHSTSAASTDYIFSNGVLSSDGCQLYSDGTNVAAIFSKAGAYTGPQVAVNLRDGYYHVIQVVKRGTSSFLYVDGTVSPIAIVDATYGITPTANFIIGDRSDLARKWQGNILYFRLDAEALSIDRLNYERNQLMGIGPRSGTNDIGYDFSRTTTAAQRHSDGTISYVAANMPRTGGDGGGVLIEGQSTNLLTYSEAQSNAAWSVTNLTNPPVAYTGLDPAGTTTGYILAEDGTAAAEHKIARASWVTVTASTPYTLSAWVKAINRTWVALMIYENGGTPYYAYFDIANGKVGTTSGSPVTKIEQFANGWFRCSVAHATGVGITQVDTAVYVAEADNDWTFDGASQNSVVLYGAQLEANYFATSYIRTTSAAVTRTQDSPTIRPYKIGKAMLLSGEKMWVDFTQDATAATLTTNGGSYVFTKGGVVTKRTEYALGEDYHSFNGTDSQYAMVDAGGAWSPAGDFSVVLIATPQALPTTGSYMYIFAKYHTTGDQRAWALYYNSSATWTFAVSQNGDSGTTSFVQKTATVIVGRPQLIIGTFDYSGTPGSTSVGKIYVDDLPVNTDAAFYGPAKAGGTADVTMGRSAAGSRFNGYIHYAAFYDGKVISDAEVATLYGKFKQANILPANMGTGYVGQQFAIEFESKCSFVSSSDIGASRVLFDISDNYGSSYDSNSNRVSIYAHTDGKVYASFYSNSSTTERYIVTDAAITNFNIWHKYKYYADLSDIANNTFYLDSVAQTTKSSMTGAHTLKLNNLSIRVGQPYDATTNSNCAFRNLRVVPGRF